MPASQTRNADAQLLGWPDHLYAKDRNFCFSAYNTGADSFTSTITLTLNTVTLNHAPEMFDFASSILTILTPGVYLVRAHGAFTMSGGGAGTAVFTLDEDPDTGSWGAIPGSQTHLYLPASTNVSFETSLLVYARAEYRYRIAGARATGSGNVQSLNNTVSLSAILLYNNE